VADLLRRGTAREPADRLASMADLVRCLEILRAGLVGARQRQQQARVAGLAVACTAALAGLAFALYPSAPASPPSSTHAPPSSTSAIDREANAAMPTSALSRTISAPPVAPPEAAAPAGDAPPPATAPAAVDAVVAAPAPVDTPPALAPAVVLTEAMVAARLATRGARLRARCAMTWIVLDLTVQRQRATLAAINGMPFTRRDPIHVCVAEQLRGLSFPNSTKPATFSLTIDLSPKDPR
jgi:hypothetical protein